MSQNIPYHLAIIMDGNRRWAEAKGLPTFEGHRRGYQVMKRVGDWCLKKGIQILTVFAFSQENWKRSKPEVKYLMKLLRLGLRQELKTFIKKKIRVNIIGRLEKLPLDLQKVIREVMEKTKENTAGILNIAINYRGRGEMVDAIKDIIKKRIPLEKITEEIVEQNLYLPDCPPPDLLIRTSGEQRISNFLLWQLAYTEFYFLKKHWPDFNEADLDRVLKEYGKRERRYGS